MTVISIILLVALVALQFFHMRERDQMRTESLIERAKLLDRIQHPEVRQIEPGDVREYDPPQDSAWMALVGQVHEGPLPDGGTDAATD